jgi:hypothetical protein
MVEVITEGSSSAQFSRRLGTWDEGQTKQVQNVVVIGESFVHPEVEEQLLYANNIGHEVRGNVKKIRLRCRSRKKLLHLLVKPSR